MASLPLTYNPLNLSSSDFDHCCGMDLREEDQAAIYCHDVDESHHAPLRMFLAPHAPAPAPASSYNMQDYSRSSSSTSSSLYESHQRSGWQHQDQEPQLLNMFPDHVDRLNGEDLQEDKFHDHEHLFFKVVTPSDVGKLNRLVIPKQHAERCFPLDPSLRKKGRFLSFTESITGKVWWFRYSYWNSSQSYVFTKGWIRFVKENKLKAGDIVSFERGPAHDFFISCRRRPTNPTTDLPPPPPPAAVDHHHNHHHHSEDEALLLQMFHCQQQQQQQHQMIHHNLQINEEEDEVEDEDEEEEEELEEEEDPNQTRQIFHSTRLFGVDIGTSSC